MAQKSKFDFKAHKKRMNKPGKWIFIVPIDGLVLTEHVGFELCISRVTFVHKSKLPRIRRRLGLPMKVSDLGTYQQEFFDASETFAVVRQSGTPEVASASCKELIREELAILSSSQLGYAKRRSSGRPAMKGHYQFGRGEELLIDSDDQRTIHGSPLVGKYQDLVLTGIWKEHGKLAFFQSLLKILNKETTVASSWRKSLKRAAILIGQSQNSDDLTKGFLWNMIALELLLTERGDKYIEALPQRMEAFLGWIGFWYTEDFPNRIKDVYRKRSEFVHDGNYSNITVEDLLFTDDLLLNLLTNLMYHSSMFRSKEDVITFAAKVEAEHLLKIRPKIRPKTLVFISRSYTEQDKLAII